MGLIKAAIGSVGGVLADQWKEYFMCESMVNGELMVKGKKVTSKRSSNTKGSENIITNGSVLVVGEGQCMIIVDQGQIVEICSIPGEYTYDISTEPSIFAGNLGDGIKDSLALIKKRFGFGGDTAHDQRVYYFNLKEMAGNKFGTINPVPFRMHYEDIGRDFTVGVKCSGQYSYRITDPLAFFTNVAGAVSDRYMAAQLDERLFADITSHLQQAFAKLSTNIRYDQLPLYTEDLTKSMQEVLFDDWTKYRGITVVRVAIQTVVISKEDEDRIKRFEDAAWNRDPLNAAAASIGAQNEALINASKNQAGAATGFMGMGMAQAAGGGNNISQLFSMAAQNNAAAPANSWKCGCGTSNTGKFCANCGKEKPLMNETGWACMCGTANTGKFCSNCGKERPAAVGWTCECGTINKGKFCSDCGKPKPAGAPLYKCDKCGWEPADPYHPPKFCAECGDPFGDEDIVK